MTRDTGGCCCYAQHLTDRQLDVLVLIAAGHTNTEIAERLCVSPETVAHHLRDMLTRADARNRAELLARAFVSGLLRDDDWPPVPTGRRCIPPQRFVDDHRDDRGQDPDDP